MKKHSLAKILLVFVLVFSVLSLTACSLQGAYDSLDSVIPQSVQSLIPVSLKIQILDLLKIDSTPDNGTTDNGTTDNGTTDNGTTDNGTTDNGTTDNGTTDNGTTETPEYPETSIADALKAADGTKVMLKGHVISIDTAWSTEYNNISVTISDGKSSIYLFRLATKVELGDAITVKGEVGSYNNSKQIAKGSTAEITGKCSYDAGAVTKEATCLLTGVKTYTCSVCGGTKTEAIEKLAHTQDSEWSSNASGHWNACTNENNCGTQLNFAAHTYENGFCTSCNYEEPINGEVPVQETIVLDFVTNFATYGAEWSNSYGEHEINFTDVGATGDGKVTLSNANKQDAGNEIDDRPVICAKNAVQYVTIDLGTSTKNIKSVTFDLKQWGTKTFADIHIEYSLDGTNWKECSDPITTPAELSSLSIPDGATMVRLSYIASNNKNTQIGLSKITLVVL